MKQQRGNMHSWSTVVIAECFAASMHANNIYTSLTQSHLGHIGRLQWRQINRENFVQHSRGDQVDQEQKSGGQWLTENGTRKGRRQCQQTRVHWRTCVGQCMSWCHGLNQDKSSQSQSCPTAHSSQVTFRPRHELNQFHICHKQITVVCSFIRVSI